MNWDRIEGRWKQFRGQCQAANVVAGKRESLAGKIQETYGLTKDETEKQLSAYESRRKEMDQPK